MSLYTFYRYSGGDNWRFEVTDKGIFYIRHETSSGDLISRNELPAQATDRLTIEIGIMKIDEIAGIPSGIDAFVEEAIKGLEECRKTMQQT